MAIAAAKRDYAIGMSATRAGAMALAVALAFAGGTARAQVVADTAPGRSVGTVVTPGANTWAITGGTTIGGVNLFHSFSQFGVPAADTATFSGAGGIANIIARVTGGARSDIYGTLSSTIAGANLWFINPAGIAFGPNSHLSVQGSFHASTASYIKFGAGGQFGMSGAPAGTLTVNPTAFGFLGAPAPITLDRSVLAVPAGKTLSLVGGSITAAGIGVAPARIQAPGGRINLASLAGPGEATFLPSGAVDTSAAGALGTIAMTNTIVFTENSGGTPGPIVIRGGRLTLTGSSMTTRNDAPGNGADIDIGLSGDFSMTSGVIRASSIGAGDAGNVVIRGANLSLAGGAVIDTSAIDKLTALGTGRAGQTTINASGDVLLTGGSALTSITFLGAGPGGDTSISARSLTLTDNANILVSTFGDGDAGRVRVAVKDLTLSRGGHIDANAEFNTGVGPGTGAGGSILVDASNAVDISGAGSGLFSKTTSYGAGGSISVNAQNIRVRDGGRISSQSVDEQGITTGGVGLGDAGSIQIDAARSLGIESGGAVTTESEGAGGGRITIRAGDLLALERGRITTSVNIGGGNGGDINIDPVFTTLNASDIIARAVDGNGGNIFIVTQFLIMSPDSSIDATSQRGISGTVQISSPASDVGSRLGVLPSAYIDPSALLRAACAARAGRPSSSFVGVGRGGLPASPDSAAYASYGSGSASAAWQGMTIRAASCPGPQIG